MAVAINNRPVKRLNMRKRTRLFSSKATDFKPEFAGKMNFYLSAVDDLMKHPDDKPSIGLLLCKGKNKVVAEYALRDINKPIGISQYEAAIVESLPKELKGSLPSIEALEQELEDKSL